MHIIVFCFSDIGLESIKRAGYSKAIDVRLMPGYPDQRPIIDQEAPATSSRRLWRALTVG